MKSKKKRFRELVIALREAGIQDEVVAKFLLISPTTVRAYTAPSGGSSPASETLEMLEKFASLHLEDIGTGATWREQDRKRMLQKATKREARLKARRADQRARKAEFTRMYRQAEAFGVSVDELADAIQLAPSTLRSYKSERGDFPSWETVARMEAYTRLLLYARSVQALLDASNRTLGHAQQSTNIAACRFEDALSLKIFTEEDFNDRTALYYHVLAQLHHYLVRF